MSAKNKNTSTSLLDLMPQDEESLRILHERALSLKKQSVDPNEISQSDKDNQVSYVRFKLGEREFYGIPFQSIKEVMLNVSHTIVPHSPKYIVGIINRYGVLLSVLNLKSFFNLSSSGSGGKQTHLLVINHQGMMIAIIVDSIEGSETYEITRLDTPLGTEDAIKQKYLLGLHRGKTAILNIEALMTDLQPHATPLKESTQ